MENAKTFPRPKSLWWDFPGGPVVGALPSKAGGVGLFPGQGAKFPYALWPKKMKSLLLFSRFFPPPMKSISKFLILKKHLKDVIKTNVN